MSEVHCGSKRPKWHVSLRATLLAIVIVSIVTTIGWQVHQSRPDSIEQFERLYERSAGAPPWTSEPNLVRRALDLLRCPHASEYLKALARRSQFIRYDEEEATLFCLWRNVARYGPGSGEEVEIMKVCRGGKTERAEWLNRINDLRGHDVIALRGLFASGHSVRRYE
jgi:hypothetical protein